MNSIKFRRRPQIRRSYSLILFSFFSVLSPFFSLAQQPPGSVAQRLFENINKLAQHPAVSFKATHSLEEFAAGAATSRDDSGYIRKIHGTLSVTGLFRYEIEYTQGSASGKKYTVSYDGGRSYIVNTTGKDNYLITKKGKITSNSYLFYAVAIAEPFAFLFPDLFSPSDQGFYVTLADLADQALWARWLSDSRMTTVNSNKSTIFEKEITTNFNDNFRLIVEIDSLSCLPVAITLKSPDGKSMFEKRTISWQEAKGGNHETVHVPRQIIIEQFDSSGGRAVLTTKIDEVDLAPNVSESFWSYDINNATTIFDGDEKLLIPGGVK